MCSAGWLFLALEVVVLVGFAWIVFGVARARLASARSRASGAARRAGLRRHRAARSPAARAPSKAVSGLMNLVMVPMWVFSGVFFASTNFPDAMQPFVQALPLTALNDALRAVMNERRLARPRIWQELAILAAWGGTAFAVALKLFRWQLDGAASSSGPRPRPSTARRSRSSSAFWRRRARTPAGTAGPFVAAVRAAAATRARCRRAASRARPRAGASAGPGRSPAPAPRRGGRDCAPSGRRCRCRPRASPPFSK